MAIGYPLACHEKEGDILLSRKTTLGMDDISRLGLLDPDGQTAGARFHLKAFQRLADLTVTDGSVFSQSVHPLTLYGIDSSI